MKKPLLYGLLIFVISQIIAIISVAVWLILIQLGIDQTEYGMGGGVILWLIYLVVFILCEIIGGIIYVLTYRTSLKKHGLVIGELILLIPLGIVIFSGILFIFVSVRLNSISQNSVTVFEPNQEENITIPLRQMECTQDLNSLNCQSGFDPIFRISEFPLNEDNSTIFSLVPQNASSPNTITRFHDEYNTIKATYTSLYLKDIYENPNDMRSFTSWGYIVSLESKKLFFFIDGNNQYNDEWFEQYILPNLDRLPLDTSRLNQ